MKNSEKYKMLKHVQAIILMIGILFLILGLDLKIFGQTDAKWKKQNEKENRYEGRISFEVGVLPIELISFYSFQDEYTTDDTLKVKFYLHDTSCVNLTAQELETREFYWMEAKPHQWQLGWNEFAPWPVREVLGRLKIPSYNLGVLVRIKKESGSGLISPAILYHSSSPSKVEFYTAYFRPGMSVAGGRYEIYKGCEGVELITKGQIGRQRAGISFPVIFRLPNDWQGLVRFRIVVKLKNIETSVPPSREYCFYHTSVL